MAPSLLDAQLLIFDVYGTLIDWETGIYTAAHPLHSRFPTPPSRTEFLHMFEEAEGTQQSLTPTMPYSELLATVYTTLAASYSLSITVEDAERFGASVGTWTPFPDTVDALARLHKYLKLVVLSNVDHTNFDRTLQLLGGEGTFDMVVTAEDVGAYKPDTKGFEHVLGEAEKQWGIPRERCCSTAQSLFHDHRPAKSLGLLGAWINRDAGVMGKKAGAGATPREWEFKTLGQMADAVEEAHLNG